MSNYRSRSRTLESCIIMSYHRTDDWSVCSARCTSTFFSYNISNPKKILCYKMSSRLNHLNLCLASIPVYVHGGITCSRQLTNILMPAWHLCAKRKRTTNVCRASKYFFLSHTPIHSEGKKITFFFCISKDIF